MQKQASTPKDNGAVNKPQYLASQKSLIETLIEKWHSGTRKQAWLNARFLRAAKMGDIPGTKRFLEAGADMEAEDKRGRTALYNAANDGQTSICDLLLGAYAKLGVDIKEVITFRDPKSISCWTVLDHAAWQGNAQTCALLIKRYAEAGGDVRDLIFGNKIGGWTMLFSTQDRNIKTCKLLLDEYEKAGGSITELILAKNDKNWTPLYHAAVNGHTKMCALIMQRYAKAGRDIKELIAAKDKEGRTALMDAALYGHNQICAMLIREYAKAGGDAKEIITATDNDGWTPLQLAANNGHAKICAMFIREYAKAGGNVNELMSIKNKRFGKTALQFAMTNASPETKQLLSVKLIEAAVGVGNKTAAAFIKSFSECIAA
jgi:ankyrin repeat protein